MKIVHCKKSPYDVYIGRIYYGQEHESFGNPFTHLPYVKGRTIKVATRKEAVDRFRRWLLGHSDQNLFPEQRRWILQHLELLRGKVLGCFCGDKLCHGSVYVELLEPKELGLF